MSDDRLYILSFVTIVLGLAAITCVLINPYAGAGLAAVLVALAKVIRAVGGDTEASEPQTTPTEETEVVRASAQESPPETAI